MNSYRLMTIEIIYSTKNVFIPQQGKDLSSEFQSFQSMVFCRLGVVNARAIPHPWHEAVDYTVWFESFESLTKPSVSSRRENKKG